MTKTYQTYKDSGIKTIGEIPTTWQVVKLRRVASNVFTGNSPVYVFEPNECLVFGQRNNQKGHLDWNGIKYADPTFFANRAGVEFLRYGDVLLNTLGGGSVGRVGYYDRNDGTPVITDGHVMVIRMNDLATQKYVYYYLSSQQHLLEDAAVGSTNQAFLTVPQMCQWKMIIPPLSEQQAIAEYLDKKTAKIDESVAALEAQKGDLQKYRAAVISEAVTRGLDAAAKMKDSGVDWIGEIPEGWKVKKLKNVATFVNGYAFDSNLFGKGNAKVIRIGDIQNEVSFDTCTTVEDSPEYATFRIRRGDVLVAMSGATTGKSCVVKEDEEAYINQRVGIIRSDWYSFVSYSLQTQYWRRHVDLRNAGSAQPNISSEAIMNFQIPIPPHCELYAIAEYLDKKTAKIDESIALIDAQIADLQAYRSAVISEAVTGKVKVS